MKTSLIVAAAENDVIGRDGDLPWHVPGDLPRFKRLTSGHVVVVGRVTHDSILKRLGHPLPSRTTIVVTHRQGLEKLDFVYYKPSVGSAISRAHAIEAAAGGNEIFVIGGALIYAAALPEVQYIYLTRIHAHIEGDTTMPEGWLNGFTLTAQSDPIEINERNSVPHSFLEYHRT